MFDMIWARWYPPEASNYAGGVRPCNGPAGLGEVNDEELNRIDEAIKSSALGGKEYVKFAYLCEMLPEPIKKYRKMIHEFIPEVIEQGYGKEKESLHVGGFIGALLGFKTGLVDDLPRNLCRDVLELLFDLLGTVCDIVDSVMPNNPDNCVAQIMRAWQSGDDFSRGRIAGNITGQVAIIVASKKFSAKVASGRALEAASAASEVGSATGVAEAAGEAAAVAREAQSAAKVAKSAGAIARSAEVASKAASVAKETQSAASVAKGAEAVAKSTAGVAKEAETVAKNTAKAAKSAETVAKGTKAASEACTAAKEAKGAAETVKGAGSAATVGEKSRSAVKAISEIPIEYSTKIDSKVTIIDRTKLPESLAKTFKDGHYRTVVTNDDICVYRLFGGRADAGGGFATTTKATSRIEAKIEVALLPEWGNSRAYEAKIVVPKGTVLSIGKVASQKISTTGTILEGGLDQILLPMDWPLDWIKNIRKVTF